MSLELKLRTALGSAADSGSDAAGPVLPTPRQHLGAGNSSPTTARSGGSANGCGCKRSQAKRVIDFQAAQLPDLAPCRSTKASTGSPDLERFKVLWPLPS